MFNDLRKITNIILLVLIAFCISIQIWLVLIFILQAHPPSNILMTTVVGEWQYQVRPERDALLYRIFVGMSLGLAAAFLWCLRHRIEDKVLTKILMQFLSMELVWTFLLLSAAFKMTVYGGGSQLASGLFIGIAVVSIVAKIFFKPLVQLIRSFYDRFHTVPVPTVLWQIIFPVILILILFIPDVEGVIARMFFGEQFHHSDSAIFAPGWAFVSGSVLNMDIISQYGLGLPIIIAQLTKVFGGFSYENVMRVMVLVNLFYFLGWYWLLVSWLKKPLLAFAALLFAIKIQMFHTYTYPIIFTYPSSTVLRYAFDILFFAFLLGHLKKGSSWYLWGASAICGASIFYMTTTGLCLLLTWGAYMASLLMFKEMRSMYLSNVIKRLSVALSIPIVVGSCFMCFWLAEGHAVLQKEFWHNTQEFNHYFLSGFGLVPLQQNIIDHNYLPLLVGLLIPLLYMLTFCLILSFYSYKKCPREHLLAVFISFYGLALYHYFIARSMSTNAYGVALPYAFILCFWASVILKQVNARLQRNVSIALLIVAAYALVTSANYVSYPNLLNVSRNPLVSSWVVNPLPDGRSYFNHLFSQLPLDGRLPVNSLVETDEKLYTEKDFENDQALKKFYREESDFSQDAALIDGLIPKGGKAALISSFETQFLMQAKRKPFFYYMPLVISRPLRMRTMVVVTLYTQGHLQRTIEQIEKEKPEYIFIEKIFNRDNITRVTFKDGSAFLPLMRYIHAHYEADGQGKFLMALKRQN